VYDLSGVRGKPSKKSPEGAIRYGLKKCGECRQRFTVKVGTVFEHARMPLRKMLQAVHLITSSKKGISAHQLHRILEVQRGRSRARVRRRSGAVPGTRGKAGEA
jgi:transposase-like protein